MAEPVAVELPAVCMAERTRQARVGPAAAPPAPEDREFTESISGTSRKWMLAFRAIAIPTSRVGRSPRNRAALRRPLDYLAEGGTNSKATGPAVIGQARWRMMHDNCIAQQLVG